MMVEQWKISRRHKTAGQLRQLARLAEAGIDLPSLLLEILNDAASELAVLVEQSDDPTLEEITKAVVAQFGGSLAFLRQARGGRHREGEVAFPRQIAMYLARALTDLTWKKIGGWFRLDHSTAIHAHKIIAARYGADLDSVLAHGIRKVIGEANAQRDHRIKAVSQIAA